jgi:hypothetical protein
MTETLSQQEVEFLHKFADKYSPQTKGAHIVCRIDDVDRRFQDLSLGVEMLVRKAKRNFPKMVEEA